MLEQEAALVAQQCAELEEQENERLRAQIEQSRAEIAVRQLMERMRKNKQIAKLIKVVGGIAAFIGLSISASQTQESAATRPVEISQSVQLAAQQAEAALKQDEQGIAVVAAQAGTEVAQPIKPETYLLVDKLKMSDQLGKEPSQPEKE
jgi:hypothetical protein